MSNATEEAITTLKLSKPKEYINYFPLSGNPLPFLIPNPGKNFFGPCVCNMVGIVNGCDGEGVADQIAFFKTVYDRFLLYETHMWVDETNFVGDSTVTEAVIQGICTSLADFGFTYHGKINAAAIGELVTATYEQFWEKVHAKFGG